MCTSNPKPKILILAAPSQSWPSATDGSTQRTQYGWRCFVCLSVFFFYGRPPPPPSFAFYVSVMSPFPSPTPCTVVDKITHGCVSCRCLFSFLFSVLALFFPPIQKCSASMEAFYRVAGHFFFIRSGAFEDFITICNDTVWNKITKQIMRILKPEMTRTAKHRHKKNFHLRQLSRLRQLPLFFLGFFPFTSQADDVGRHGTPSLPTLPATFDWITKRRNPAVSRVLDLRSELLIRPHSCP